LAARQAQDEAEMKAEGKEYAEYKKEWPEDDWDKGDQKWEDDWDDEIEKK